MSHPLVIITAITMITMMITMITMMITTITMMITTITVMITMMISSGCGNRNSMFLVWEYIGYDHNDDNHDNHDYHDYCDDNHEYHDACHDYQLVWQWNNMFLVCRVHLSWLPWW